MPIFARNSNTHLNKRASREVRFENNNSPTPWFKKLNMSTTDLNSGGRAREPSEGSFRAATPSGTRGKIKPKLAALKRSWGLQPRRPLTPPEPSPGPGFGYQSSNANLMAASTPTLVSILPPADMQQRLPRRSSVQFPPQRRTSVPPLFPSPPLEANTPSPTVDYPSLHSHPLVKQQMFKRPTTTPYQTRHMSLLASASVPNIIERPLSTPPRATTPTPPGPSTRRFTRPPCLALNMPLPALPHTPPPSSSTSPASLHAEFDDPPVPVLEPSPAATSPCLPSPTPDAILTPRPKSQALLPSPVYPPSPASTASSIAELPTPQLVAVCLVMLQQVGFLHAAFRDTQESHKSVKDCVQPLVARIERLQCSYETLYTANGSLMERVTVLEAVNNELRSTNDALAARLTTLELNTPQKAAAPACGGKCFATHCTSLESALCPASASAPIIPASSANSAVTTGSAASPALPTQTPMDAACAERPKPACTRPLSSSGYTRQHCRPPVSATPNHGHPYGLGVGGHRNGHSVFAEIMGDFGLAPAMMSAPNLTLAEEGME